MSNAQNSTPASDSKHHEPGPDREPDQTANAHSQTFRQLGVDECGDAGGHGLLSRPSAPPVRRSLFRR